MADTPFPHLFSPLQIGPVTLRNRIVSSGHDTVMAVEGKATPRLIAYQEARARGGAGLIVVQVAGVHVSAMYTSSILMADDDTCIESLTALVDAIHAHGATVFQQLFHDGRELMESGDGTLPVALAPSAVPNERFHVMPREMTRDEVVQMVGHYAAAADRIRRCGYDGIEIVASHGYLPSQFLNPHTNRRTDDYGGSFANRLRFLREVLEQCRDAAGPGMAVGLRISIGEEDEQGLSADDAVNAVRDLDAAGLLDYVNVTIGTSATLEGSGHIVPPMARQPGYTVPRAARLREVVRCPIIVAGRINQPQEAERFIASGQVDATVMTRALICDPEMPNRAAAGELDDIRACIACNQACIGHFHLGYPISCIQHPETGRELTLGIRVRTASPKRVLVVGGGPGGMKAAAVAAERGHQVTLVEASGRLGGQVLLAQLLPGRAEFGGAVTNLAREMERAGVEVRLNSRMDADSIRALAPDHVVLATGAGPRRPDLELIGEPNVVTAWEVLQGRELPTGRRVVVADWRSDWIGLGVATLLAQRGHPVTLAVSGYHAGQRIQQYVRDGLIAEALRHHVEIVPLVRPFGADSDTAYFQHVLTREPVMFEPIGALVLSQGHDALDELSASLTGAPFRVERIGDCLAPRTVEEAVLEGLKVASAI